MRTTNPIRLLARRLRFAWLFDFERQLSFVVALPIEAAMDVLSKAATESTSMYQRYWETVRGSRRWFENPYGGTVWNNGFSLRENNISRNSYRLQIEGRVYAESNKTRIELRMTIPGITNSCLLVMLLTISAMLLLLYAWLIAHGLSGGTVQSIFPQLCIPPFFLLFVITLHWGGWNAFKSEASKAENWFQTIYAPYGIQIVSEITDGAK